MRFADVAAVVGVVLEESSKTVPQQMEDVLGTTTKFEQSGWLLPNGKLVDMGFKPDREKRPHEYSQCINHIRALQLVFPKEKNIRHSKALEAGCIRLIYDAAVVMLMYPPTDPQRVTLKKFIEKVTVQDVITIDYLDPSGLDGIVQDSQHHPMHSSADRVLRDIDDFYNKGKRTTTSITAQWREGRRLTEAVTEKSTMKARVAGTLKTKALKAGTVVYHGTMDEKDARSILKSGLRKGTKDMMYGYGPYFSLHAGDLRDIYGHVISCKLARDVRLCDNATADQSLDQVYRELFGTYDADGLEDWLKSLGFDGVYAQGAGILGGEQITLFDPGDAIVVSLSSSQR